MTFLFLPPSGTLGSRGLSPAGGGVPGKMRLSAWTPGEGTEGAPGESTRSSWWWRPHPSAVEWPLPSLWEGGGGGHTSWGNPALPVFPPCLVLGLSTPPPLCPDSTRLTVTASQDLGQTCSPTALPPFLPPPPLTPTLAHRLHPFLAETQKLFF